MTPTERGTSTNISDGPQYKDFLVGLPTTSIKVRQKQTNEQDSTDGETSLGKPEATTENNKMSKRQQKKAEKEAKAEASEQARREGVTIIPAQSSLQAADENTSQDPVIHNNAAVSNIRRPCICRNCKFWTQDGGSELCPDDDVCPNCDNVRKLINKVEGKCLEKHAGTIASLEKQYKEVIARMENEHQQQLQDASQAKCEVDDGLLEARRDELIEKRNKQIRANLIADLNSIQKEFFSTEEAHETLKKQVEEAEKEFERKKIEHLRATGEDAYTVTTAKDRKAKKGRR